jgi:hypothetical protein
VRVATDERGAERGPDRGDRAGERDKTVDAEARSTQCTMIEPWMVRPPTVIRWVDKEIVSDVKPSATLTWISPGSG